MVLARRTLNTGASTRTKGPNGGQAGHHSPHSFGERVLGAGAARGGVGDWRLPAGVLLRYCGVAEGEASREEAVPEEVERFFVELGLEPTPTISKKCVRCGDGRGISVGYDSSAVRSRKGK